MASAATLARPDLLAVRSARISCAEAGCSVSTSCRLWPERVFHGRHETVRHADALRQRADDRAGLPQSRRPRRHRTPHARLPTAPARSGASASRPADAETCPVRRRRPASRPATGAAGSGVPPRNRAWWPRSAFPPQRWRRKFLQPRFQPDALLFQLHLFRR